MLGDSTMDDVLLTQAFTGMNTSFLLPSIEAAGLDPATLDHNADVASARAQYGGSAYSDTSCPRRLKDIWSAGHSVSGVAVVPDKQLTGLHTDIEVNTSRAPP